MRHPANKVQLIGAIACLLTVALSPGSAWAERKVIFAAGADAESLDPALHPAGTADALQQVALYDTLVFQEADGTISPALATSWEFKDSTTVLFKLRRGVRHHDGTPFKAEDVKSHFDRVFSTKAARWVTFINMVKSVRVADDLAVEVKLKYPFAPFLAHLSLPIASIPSPAALKRHGKDFRRKPVGTGPFVLKRWVPGEYIQFAANPNYWGGRPAIDELEFRPIPEDTTRVLQLRAGEIHLALYVHPAQMAEVERDPRLELVKAPLFRVVFVGMNNLIKPFDNPLVRQAVNYAVDTRAIVERVMLGVGQRIGGPFGPATWGYDPSFEAMGYPHDLAKARELLKRAGYPEGFETEFWHPSGRYTADKEAAQAIQAQLARAGIRVRLRTGDWSLVAPTVRDGKAPIYLYGWSVMSGDADSLMFLKFHSSTWGRRGNYTRYKNPQVDRLLEQARAALDPAQRKAIYKEAVRLVVQDAPWVFFKEEVMLVGKSKKLQGVIFHPSERVYFHRARLAD